MAKKAIATIKLQVKGGQANPSPPVGPALGQHGVNIMEFCKAFNARTQNQEGVVVPVVITVYGIGRRGNDVSFGAYPLPQRAIVELAAIGLTGGVVDILDIRKKGDAFRHAAKIARPG